MIWKPRHPQFHPDMLGYIPLMFEENDPRSAREQIDSNYAHGGGWNPTPGFVLSGNNNLFYRGDPPILLLAETVLHANTSQPEIIRFYQHAWVAIVQADGSYEVSRMD